MRTMMPSYFSIASANLSWLAGSYWMRSQDPPALITPLGRVWLDIARHVKLRSMHPRLSTLTAP